MAFKPSTILKQRINSRSEGRLWGGSEISELAQKYAEALT
jgi:hypothetical protein